MASTGKVVGSTASGAALGTAIMPGWGTAIGAGVGLLGGLFSGGGDNAAATPAAAQYGGNPTTDQIAAQQYAEGLSQQQAQNAREAAFYNQGNQNFDIANQAQMRQGPQIASTLADKQRQLEALGGTNAAIGNVNSSANQLAALGAQSSNAVTATGDRLTALGTRPMGPSYAEAQLQQGLAGSMAQQLSMARSGRSLGSGQAAMQQAAFNNASLNQQTNQAAAAARIQEQNAYNQFQANTLGAAGQQYNANNQFQASALGAAGQQYGAAGALAGQAGNQATGIRTGNENVQLQNAQLGQAQQGINNQTTGLYNQLGSQQQQLGMQANQAGQNAFQFGQTQASGALQAQANADTGRLSAATATNLANQQNANLHDAATANSIASAAGGIATLASGSGDVPQAANVNQNNPSGSTSPYKNITTASNGASSDERLKKNITPVEPGASIELDKKKPGLLKAPPRAAAEPAHVNEWATGTGGRQADGSLDFSGSVQNVTAPAYTNPASYAETIAALNAGYAPSQRAPTDVLNHVAGAGAGPSASQSSLLQYLGKPSAAKQTTTATQAGGINNARVPDATPQLFATSAGPHGTSTNPATPTASTRPAAQTFSNAPPSANWGDVFNQPTLDPRVADYLGGGNPNAVAVPVQQMPPAQLAAGRQALASGAAKYGAGYVNDYTSGINATPEERGKLLAKAGADHGEAYMKQLMDDLMAAKGVSSDSRSKTRIRQLEGQLAALQGPPSAAFSPQQPDTAALDASEYGQQTHKSGWRDRDQLAGPSSYHHRWDADPFSTAAVPPAVDLRQAQGFEYEYKNPGMPGAAPGKHIGPMAQDLEGTAAAGAVHDTPYGKQVDTKRLTMVNTAALSELQRKMQRLEALGGGQQAPDPYKASLYPSMR